MKSAPSPNPVEAAEKLRSWFDHFVTVKGYLPFYRTLGPGMYLASFIRNFTDYADNSNCDWTKRRADELHLEYSALYKRLTGFDFDSTAPTVPGNYWDLLDSLGHLDDGHVNDILCTCERCNILR